MAVTSSMQDIKTRKFWVALLAELVGTAVLVLVGCGSCSLVPSSPQVKRHLTSDGVQDVILHPEQNQQQATFSAPSIVQIALTFGLAVGTVVWAIAHVSGGHINPAVTFGFLVSRKISVLRAVLYVVAQCIGAVVGAGLLKVLTPTGRNPSLGTSSPAWEQDVGALQALGVEGFITFVLVLTVFATCDGQRKGFNGSGPLAIGLSVTLGHLWAVPVTGAGTNPARVFGPALVSFSWVHHWAYWIGPLIGGGLAAVLYDFLFAQNATPTKLRHFFRADYDDSNFDEHGRHVSNNNNNIGDDRDMATTPGKRLV